MLVSSLEHAEREQAPRTSKLSCRGEGKHWANTHSYPILKGSIPKAGHRSGRACGCFSPRVFEALSAGRFGLLLKPGLGQHRVCTLCPIVAKRLLVPHQAVIGTWAVKIQDDLANAISRSQTALVLSLNLWCKFPRRYTWWCKPVDCLFICQGTVTQFIDKKKEGKKKRGQEKSASPSASFHPIFLTLA